MSRTLDEIERAAYVSGVKDLIALFELFHEEIGNARDAAYNKGRDDGYDDGYDDGCEDTRAAIEAEHDEALLAAESREG